MCASANRVRVHADNDIRADGALAFLSLVLEKNTALKSLNLECTWRCNVLLCRLEMAARVGVFLMWSYLRELDGAGCVSCMLIN